MEPYEGHAVCPECGYLDDAAARAPLFVVTGASGAGKTTVLAPLARRLRGRCVTFDIDWLIDPAADLSYGRPIRWGPLRDAWLAVAHGVAQSGLPTVLLGPLIPEHLESLANRRWIADTHFIALDCPDELRRERINARPSWRSHDMDQQVEFGRWLRDNIAESIDTSNGSPDETAAAIAEWVDRHLAASAPQRSRS